MHRVPPLLNAAYPLDSEQQRIAYMVTTPSDFTPFLPVDNNRDFLHSPMVTIGNVLFINPHVVHVNLGRRVDISPTGDSDHGLYWSWCNLLSFDI